MIGEAQPNPEQTPVIPSPDILNSEEFETWLGQYITTEHYDISHNDKKHPDGTPFSKDERAKATREQCRIYAREGAQLRQLRPERFGIPQIAEMIRGYVQDMYKPTSSNPTSKTV